MTLPLIAPPQIRDQPTLAHVTRVAPFDARHKRIRQLQALRDMREFAYFLHGARRSLSLHTLVMEAEMDIPNVDRSLAKLGVSRRARKKIGRISRSPKARVAAALVPLLTAGLIAARTFARRGS